MTAIKRLWDSNPVSIAPLVSFRISFGLLMFFSLLRFWWRGWITTVYVQPRFHFTYWGFEWVQPLGYTGMHLLFAVLIIAALFIALGFFYRIAIVVFFLGFTYVELIDVTTYLNHYYFISLVSFIMIWLPASRDYSLDMRRNPQLRRLQVSAWTIRILQFQMGIVYIFAGLAKINTAWLIHAEPMRTWLPAKSHLPLVGPFMYETWVAYLFSWFGALYDLFIVFFLLNKKTRPIAYLFVLIFHLATALFFPAIGMFPYVMIVSSLIFFSGRFHERLLSHLPFYKNRIKHLATRAAYKYHAVRFYTAMLVVYICLQIMIPLRFLLYPGYLFWHEEGYRFSWRVMLMEKAGTAYFTVKDKTGRQFYEVDNKAFLTPLQEKMMSTQPDMILKYAHYLAAEYAHKGIEQPRVYAEIYVALNGRRSELFVDSTVDLAAEKLSWRHYNWVLPYRP
ncbi:MAG: HTTM domain-containing protein [Agriterribacter sp.]